MTRTIIMLLVCALVLPAVACQSQPETPQFTVPEEVIRPYPVVPSATATLVEPGVTATPVKAMKRTSPARFPPERVVAPSIDLDAPVRPMQWRNTQQDGVEVTEWSVPADAAGYQVGSSFPGQRGNVVLSGHHNIQGRVFEDLWRLLPGDSVSLYAAEEEFRYAVEDTFLLRELGAPPEQRYQNAQWVGPTVDERLTLVTCWPPTGNAYRLIVVAKPVSQAAARTQESGNY
ncbi:MAG: hypothetical protein MAG451_03175 [Anaerolineales bacterium]|nr:hypothetical protein [Anaerolineales bacterium]